MLWQYYTILFMENCGFRVLVNCNYANFISWHVGRALNILLVNWWLLNNCILHWKIWLISEELWVQHVELCCMSEPGYHAYVEELTHKHGTIAGLWISPHLTLVVAEAMYVEVSNLALAVWTKQHRQFNILSYGVTVRSQFVWKCNCLPLTKSYKW